MLIPEHPPSLECIASDDRHDWTELQQGTTATGVDKGECETELNVGGGGQSERLEQPATDRRGG